MPRWKPYRNDQEVGRPRRVTKGGRKHFERVLTLVCDRLCWGGERFVDRWPEFKGREIRIEVGRSIELPPDAGEWLFCAGYIRAWNEPLSRRTRRLMTMRD